MDVKNCRHCGKIYIYTGNPCCHDCMELLEAQYLKIRRYIQKHPDADIDTLVKETGVEQKIILQMLREGRLQSRGSIGLYCRSCRAAIDSGILCPKCLAEMQNINTTTGTPGRTSSRQEQPRSRAFHTNRVRYK